MKNTVTRKITALLVTLIINMSLVSTISATETFNVESQDKIIVSELNCLGAENYNLDNEKTHNNENKDEEKQINQPKKFSTEATIITTVVVAGGAMLMVGFLKTLTAGMMVGGK